MSCVGYLGSPLLVVSTVAAAGYETGHPSLPPSSVGGVGGRRRRPIGSFLTCPRFRKVSGQVDGVFSLEGLACPCLLGCLSLMLVCLGCLFAMFAGIHFSQ